MRVLAVLPGGEEGSLEEQWQRLADSAELLAMAPDDEISAEMLALQAELLQQMAVNRTRSAALLATVIQDLPRQEQAAAERKQGIEIARACFSVSCGPPPASSRNLANGSGRNRAVSVSSRCV